MYNYVVTAQKPTAVTHSVVGNFTSPPELNLILSKSTRIEIHLLTNEGLQPLLDVPIYGRIATMELYRAPGENKDSLFIATERHKFCILSYDDKTGEIVTRANGDVHDKIGKLADVGQIGTVDPEVRMIGLHLFDGMFKIIPFEKGAVRDAFNTRLEELLVLDIKFLYGYARPTIAVLSQDTKSCRHVKTYEVNVKEKELREGPWSFANVEAAASMLIPVPLPFGGALIVGEQSITYQSPQPGSFKAIAIKNTVMKAYGRVDPDGSRYLLGDNSGNLYVLLLIKEDGHANRVADLRVELLGQTSIPSTISYLDNGFIFLGSGYGDSQLIKLNSEKENGTYIEIVETFTNLGPILDFSVVDLDRQGQGQVVTCSGAFKDGSLRVVRNGIGINEQATIELAGVKGIWSLRPSTSSQFDKYIVVSFLGETRFLAIAGEELEETEIPGFSSSARTLFCGNVAGDRAIQVTPQGVRLINATTLELQSEWKPEAGLMINVASCNSSQILLATGGGNLFYLTIIGNELKLAGKTQLEHEIACVNITPIEGEEARVAAVGMWTDITVRILQLPSLTPIVKESLGGEIIPRSVLFATFDGVHYLLCGLGDGHIFNWIIDPSNYSLRERKKISLGTKPIILNTFKTNDQINVFAASDRPTVIYSSNKKLLYSTVNLKEVDQMCPFNTESFPDSLAIATENSLSIGTIDEIQKLHIRSIPLGEMPRRIAYQESTRSFAILTIKYTTTSDGDREERFVRLIDDQTFEVLSSYPLDENENGCSLISCNFLDDPNPYFVVGTAYLYPSESEPTKGRVLVFQVQATKLTLISEKETKGAVLCLNAFNGHLLTGVNSRINLYFWQDTKDGGKELELKAGHIGHVFTLFIASRGDFVIVGDLMKSISLFLYKPEGVLEEIAKDYNPNWVTAVEALDDDTFIGAENEFNLYTVKRTADAPTDEERGRLETVGEFHIGEFVQTFKRGSLVMKLPESEGLNLPTLLYGTVNGVIGVVASLPAEMYQFFWQLQSYLPQVIKGVGGFDHAVWRSFSTESKTVPAKGFIDGDLIESALDLKRDKLEDIAKHMKVSVEDLIKKIEGISQALH